MIAAGDAYWAALSSYLESIKCGVTTVNDMYRQLGGLGRGRVQAEPDVEQAAHDPVQQVLGVLRLLREHGADQADEVLLGPLVCGVPDHRQDEMAAGGRDRPQRDRHRDEEPGSVHPVWD